MGGRGSYRGRGRGRGQERGRGRQSSFHDRGNKKGYIECFHCHKPRHKISECWNKYPGLKNNKAGMVHEDKSKNSHETLLIASNKNVGDVWYLDSGASRHMTRNKNLFSKLVEVNHGQITIGDAKSYKIQGVGDITFKTKSRQVERMSEVYYVMGCRAIYLVLRIS